MKRLLVVIGQTTVFFSLVLCTYAVGWGVWARLGHDPAAVVDLRQSRSDKPYCILFCASLASNLYGFPGHAYIVWDDQRDDQRDEKERSCRLDKIQALSGSGQATAIAEAAVADSSVKAGFVPCYARDQIRSMFQAVPGYLVRDASKGNLRNLDCLIAIVDEDSYRRALQLKDSWDAKSFQVGVRDCVAFVDVIARQVGLETPKRDYLYPQEYLARLKLLNRKRAVNAPTLAGKN